MKNIFTLIIDTKRRVSKELVSDYLKSLRTDLHLTKDEFKVTKVNSIDNPTVRCDCCGIETDEYITTIYDENLCFGCDRKRLKDKVKENVEKID